MQRTNFILGVALLVVAATLAIIVTLRSPRHEQEAATPAPSVNRSSRASVSAPRASPRRSQRPDTREQFSVSAPLGHPDQESLDAMALQVQADATHKLGRLTEQLDLTKDQRRKLFPILARSSTSYDARLQISGLPTGEAAITPASSELAVEDVLEPGQQDQLIEDAMSDLTLWQELITGLQERLEEETPEIVVPTPEEPVVPSPPRRGNLFETTPSEE